MNIGNKNILVLGLGITGISSAKALAKLGARVIVNDTKTENELSDIIKQLRELNISFMLGTDEIELDNIDLIIKSPGIPLNNPIVKKAQAMRIEIVTDIELAYRISNNLFIAITGTNGKTTTTTLIGEIINNSNYKCHVTGNIGVGILWEIVNSSKDDFFVIEASSFQLESTKYFKPKVSLIINITPDHINWHGSFESYVKSKAKIYANQDENDITILNYDDPILRNMGSKIKAKLIYFSRKEHLDRGVYVNDNYIVINDGNNIVKVMEHKDIRIPGNHNLENALASVATAWAIGIPLEVIASTLKEFQGVEHRLEHVDNIKGISFYNDSKGTNPDSSIKAVETLSEPIILIAGGYDKGSDFNHFVESFNGKVKALILLGDTASKIKDTAIKNGLKNIYIVEDMREATLKAYEIGKAKDNVLLSPACASWDMYKSYEERGKDFKKAVDDLRRLLNDQRESQ